MKLKVALGKGNKKRIVKPTAILMLIVLGIVFSFSLAEYMVRKIVSLPLQKQFMQFMSLMNYSVPRDLADEDLFWITKFEFRGRKHSLEKSRGMFRIICLGDSCTQGFVSRQETLPYKETFAYKLEEVLRNGFNSEKVEVINAGIGGYSSLQGLRYLKRSLWQYKPDLIISWFGVNDDGWALFYKDKEQKIPRVEDLRKKTLLEHSNLYLLFKNELFAEKFQRVSAIDYYKNLEKMYLFAKEKNIEVVFVFPFRVDLKRKKVSYYDDYKEKLEQLNFKYGCKVIDLVPELSRIRNIDELYMDPAHPNAAGHTIVANIIARFINRN